MSIFDAKQDDRPAKGGWAPGDYINACGCGCIFSGEKRAWQCADCAYAEPKIERFVSTGTPVTPEEGEILTILIEECSEVIHRACKMLRFGKDEVQPGQPEDNTVRLSGEAGDLEAMLDEAKKRGLILPLVVDHFAELKPIALAKYMQKRNAA
jgi:hypothetical protein